MEPGLADEQVFTGTVDTGGSQIIDVVWTRGSNTAHSAGATVVDYVTGTVINMITKGILVGHNQDGTHKALVAPSATLSGNASIGGTLGVTGASTMSSLVTSGNITVGGKSSSAVQSISSSSTLTPDMDNYNNGECTALATNTTVAAPSGSPADGQWYTLTITASGGTRTIGWNATYVPLGAGVVLPTSLASGKTAVISFRYSDARSRMEVLGVAVEG